MTRQLLSFCLGSCLLALLPALEARAEELPVRKAGLWEMKMVRTGSPLPEMTMQHCTDETTDKEMSHTRPRRWRRRSAPSSDIQKTATGYVSDSVCSVAGMSIDVAFRDHRRFQFRLHASRPPRTARAARPACRATPR